MELKQALERYATERRAFYINSFSEHKFIRVFPAAIIKERGERYDRTEIVPRSVARLDTFTGLWTTMPVKSIVIWESGWESYSEGFFHKYIQELYISPHFQHPMKRLHTAPVIQSCFA